MTQVLWTPSKERVENSNLKKFMEFLAIKYGLKLGDYNQLHAWSVDNYQSFWKAIWEFGNPIAENTGDRITNNSDYFYDTHFFPDAKINFAENLLARRDNADAIVFWGEDKLKKRFSYKELYEHVAKTAIAMKNMGIKPNDVIGGYVANTPETTIAALAAISIGAIWCSCSPDFGAAGALDRLGQVKPKILFATDGYYYRGKLFDNSEKIVNVVKELKDLKQVVIIPYVNTDIVAKQGGQYINFYDFSKDCDCSSFKFERFEFNHPIYILFTSGTTGVPKCIIHGAGGTLLQHIKEHRLHCDIKENDRVFYFTTCSWMMWNWHTSVLASKATLLQYDGSPLSPDYNVLFDYADAEDMTLFGTSAKFLDILYKMDVSPKKTHFLSKLNTVACTGSPLSPESAEYVYKNIKEDVHLNCFSGGTDIISCFITGNPISSVNKGEMQSVGLGMSVKVFNDNGVELKDGEQGELVCTKPFPSQPIGFWNDPSNMRYIKAYFEKFPGNWCHGDWIERTKNNRGIIISGRADAVLNPGGIRIGTGEIYNQVSKIEEVLECVAVGQKWDDDERIILFVVLREGVSLTDELRDRIKKQIKTGATPRHVPSKIIAVRAIPKTKNGKITEIAVRTIINGGEVKNTDALDDASVLEYYKNIVELKN